MDIWFVVYIVYLLWCISEFILLYLIILVLIGNDWLLMSYGCKLGESSKLIDIVLFNMY